MNLPLHKDAQDVKKCADFHAGLWYDRFFDRYDQDWNVPKDEKGKLDWISTVTSNAVGSQSKLTAFAARQCQFVDSLGGKQIIMSTDWHFVTGLGNNHPVENGFAWHPTLGVPYLTGAAVKGMLRAWCEVWEEGFDDEKLRHWYGDTDQAGALIFFDAVPTSPVKLQADIMTPHYGKWYAEGATRPNQPDTIPADWHDPNPVPFLVVDKDASFQFAVAKRNTRQAAGVDLGEVMDKLQDALRWIGAGAKTAAGYGRMQRDKGLEKRISEAAKAAREEEEKKARQTAMSPLQIELDEWFSQPDNIAEPLVGSWLDRMEKADEEDALEIAKALDQFFKRVGKYDHPSKKQKNKRRITNLCG